MSNNFADTYFSLNDCRKIGYIRQDIEDKYYNCEINKRERALLITSLLYAMDKSPTPADTMMPIDEEQHLKNT